MTVKSKKYMSLACGTPTTFKSVNANLAQSFRALSLLFHLTDGSFGRPSGNKATKQTGMRSNANQMALATIKA